MVELLVGTVLRRAASIAPHGPAVSLGDARLTFAELDVASANLADVLRSRGIGREARLAWRGRTSLDAVILFAAAARLGVTFVPINSLLGELETADVLDRADPDVLADDEWLTGSLDEASRSADRADAPGRQVAGEEEVRETDAHVIFFTSGSTGRPKGVVLSHRTNVLRSAAANTMTPRGATVCMFPLFHMASWSLALGCWQCAEEVVFVPRADADVLLGAVEARRARRLYAIPAVWGRILGSDLSVFDLSSLTDVDTGTSATPPELITALREAFPRTSTHVLYGSTEAGPGTVLGPEDLSRKPGSVGRPCAFTQLRLSERGEVLLHSPFLMDGYFRDPEATAEALAGGWYHTGDLGSLDAEGFLAIVGRARDVIRTGGETVAPVEVEAAVGAHPSVAEVAVIGLPDPAWGEVVCAAVVLRPGAELDLPNLQAHCANRLARFKVPRQLVVVDALPRTAATGQVQRTLLLERLGLA
jgi:fatty-acyl-CoA synthase